MSEQPPTPNTFTGDLTLEQQFHLGILSSQVRNLTLEQAQEMVIELTRQRMVRDNLLKNWMKTH